MVAVVALANLTLGSTTASVTFSGFASTYRDLYIVSNAGNSASNTFFWVQFNSDTAANYNAQGLNAQGSAGAFAAVAFSQTSISNASGNSEINVSSTGALQLDILDYSQTNKWKNCIARINSPNNAATTWGGTWKSTAAITSIKLFPSAGSFSSGSTFALYGVNG